MLKRLNQKEAIVFSNEIWNWDDYHLYQISDPIIFCANKFLNEDYLYLRIISAISNQEYLDYLVENVVSYFPNISLDRVEKWETSMLIPLRRNILIVSNTKDALWRSKLQQSADYLTQELDRRKNASSQ